MASQVIKSGDRRRKPRTTGRKPKSVWARILLAADRLAFNWKIREALYRHLSTQIGNGISVEVALDSFRARLMRRKKVDSDRIVADVSRRMRGGSTLANALSQWIPQDEVGVIHSGELSGNIPRSLDLLIEAKRRISRVGNTLKSSMSMPAFYVLLLYGTLWFIGAYVTADLQQALPKAKAQGLIYAMYVGGDLANSLWALFPPVALACLMIVVIRSLPRWTGKHRIAAEKYFPYSFYRDMQGYVWLVSFAALLRAGMADVEILKRQQSQASPWLKERLQALGSRMQDGTSLSAALLGKGKSGMPPFGFPNPEIVDDISSMHGFPDFPEKIAILASQWSEELEESTKKRAARYGFWMEIIMYLIMGLLMVAINQMGTQIGSSLGSA